MCKCFDCSPVPLLSFSSVTHGTVLVYSSSLASRIVDGSSMTNHLKQIIHLDSLIPSAGSGKTSGSSMNVHVADLSTSARDGDVRSNSIVRDFLQVLQKVYLQ